MTNGVLILADKLKEIYYLYEAYIWRNEDIKLNILIRDHTIDVWIAQDNKIIDRHTLTFNESENNMYRYLALSLFNTALGCVRIHRKDNTFYNNVHKPYLNFTIFDEAILNMVEELMYFQDEVFVHEAINKMYPQIPFSLFKKDTLEVFDKQVELTKKLLRSRYV